MKICTKCNENKSLSDFIVDKRNKNGRGNICRECKRLVNKNHRLNHPEKVKASKKKWYDNNPEKVREINRKWAKSNPQSVSEKSKRFRQTEKGRAMTYRYNVKRRSYKHKVRFTPHDRKQILDRDKWTCQCCGIKVHDDKVNNQTKAHIDHVVPISRGGNSEPSNLQILCRTCNLSKSDKVVV